MGDAAVQILILIGDLFEVEGGGEPSVVDVFGQSDGNIFSISPLESQTDTDRSGAAGGGDGLTALLKVTRQHWATHEHTHVHSHTLPN